MILEDLSLTEDGRWQRLYGLFFAICAGKLPHVWGFHASLKPFKPLIRFIFGSGG